jgi:4,5-DOPA dioxygenase extradiol
MPRYVALGAGGDKGRVLHRKFSWGSIGMTSFAFGDADEVAA